MSRLVSTMGHDVRLQLRNGFYAAVAFLVAVFFIVLSQLPEFDWAPILPPFLLGNLAMATFFFMAGLVLLEKGEGTLEAQVVSPLTTREYLGSKLVTLTGLSLAESALIVIIAKGFAVNWAPLLLGVAMAAALYTLFGFAAVVRYRSINELLFPTMVWVTLFSLPILHYADVWSTPLMYAHPFQAPLVLMAGASRDLAAWEWAYGLGCSALWIGLAQLWSERAWQRFVVAPVSEGRS